MGKCFSNHHKILISAFYNLNKCVNSSCEMTYIDIVNLDQTATS